MSLDAVEAIFVFRLLDSRIEELESSVNCWKARPGIDRIKYGSLVGVISNCWVELENAKCRTKVLNDQSHSHIHSPSFRKSRQLLSQLLQILTSPCTTAKRTSEMEGVKPPVDDGRRLLLR